MNKKSIIFAGILLTALIGLIYFVVVGPPAATGTKTGIVTKIIPNCGAVVELIDGKEVVDKESSGICDGGSFIRVDDLLIQTATGLVASGMFDKSVAGIKLGDKVTAKYVEDKNGLATLNCANCGIYK